MVAKRFEDLLVWQQSRELVKAVYSITNDWRDRSLQDQIRRAAVSVLSNIAEGFERGTKEEFLYFLYIARGSCGEVRAQLYVAIDQKFISETQFETTSDKADHVSRLLARFIDGYKAKGLKGQKFVPGSDKDIDDFEEKLQRIIKGETVSL